MKLGSAGLAVSSISLSRPIRRPGEPLALRLGAHVAPDERGAQDPAVLVEHDGAVHLAGEGGCFDIDAGYGGEDIANGGLGGAPPVLGVLLGPARMRRAKRLMLGRGRGDEVSFYIHQNGARAAGADIHSQKHDVSPDLYESRTM